MYKSIKITKRYSVAFNTFRKAAKSISKAYVTGYHKKTDEINSFDTHFFVLGRFRIMIYVTHKNPIGHSCG